jgi:hypothetical protein
VTRARSAIFAGPDLAVAVGEYGWGVYEVARGALLEFFQGDSSFPAFFEDDDSPFHCFASWWGECRRLGYWLYVGSFT